MLLARILSSLAETCQVRVGGFRGGLQTNAICREAEAKIAFPVERREEVEACLEAWERILKKEFKISDPDVRVGLAEPAEGWGVLTPERDVYKRQARTWLRPRLSSPFLRMP